jgi:ADP-glucose pyrophosphorylase
MDVAPKLDIVTVGFTGEMRLLQLQARSLRLYADPAMINRIYIVCNDKAFRPFQRFVRKHVLPEYGPLADKVTILDYRTIIGRKINKTGWRSQQVLKLLMARYVEADQFLILDSKNHFIRPVSSSTFISPRGKLRMYQMDINEAFRNHLNAACSYFGVVDGPVNEKIFPTATPFVMSTRVTQDLLKYVEQREGTDFTTFFLPNRSFNEFYFYQAYILSKDKLIETLYEVRDRIALGFFSGASKTPDRIKYLMPVLDQSEMCCTGVHRHILEEGIPDNLQAIADMWKRFGLVTTSQEVEYFQTYTPALKRKRFWIF